MGSLLHGQRYRIQQVIGQGGFGITYRAEDLNLRREVAIKELFPQGCTRQGTLVLPVTGSLELLEHTRKDFLKEGQALAKFQHPGIVRVMDTFEENHTAYLVMEFLQGETLGERLASGPLSPEETLKIAIRSAEALQDMHQAGILHRDIKPENLFLEGSGRVVLIDFGSSRPYQSEKTMQYTRMVTPGYAAPEQYATQAKFAPYTDIYALGATLYHALTGQPPVNATDRLLGMKLPEVSGKVPAFLKDAVQSSLSLNVQDRPQSAQNLLNLLQGAPLQPRQKPAERPVAVQTLKAENASWFFLALGALLGFRYGLWEGALVVGAVGFFLGRFLWWSLPFLLPLCAFWAGTRLSQEFSLSSLGQLTLGALGAYAGVKAVKWMGR
ncbi:hypothetical protein GCM10008938_48060 [Deinococcus roseus]|uniref:Protein kinase domain-containing protein n=1 Tax=Deinococcus roseus TaxID=392414 RepID=A0ABQ2DFH9_9DEIO|nr:hypothetical protein GCM10008938_48060 [Deinococcus roseus]